MNATTPTETATTVPTMEGTVQQAWHRATRALRKDGVAFFFNVSSCCRGCVDLIPKLKSKDQPVGWTFAGQGNRLRFNDDGNPYYMGYGKMYRSAEQAYIYHDNNSGEKIAEAFRAEGFTVDWDGNYAKAVVIVFTP